MKRILITLLTCAIIGTLYAQSTPVTSESSASCYWAENWFVELSVGAEMLFAPDASLRPFGRRISPAVSLAAGKWFTPFIGARLQIKGFQMLGGRTAYGIYLNDPISGNTLFGNNDPVRDYVTVYPAGKYYTPAYYQNSHLTYGRTACRL